MSGSWARLPTDVERHIMACLSLPELAKVAPTSKAFYNEYRARCQADEARLSPIAYSVFGQRLIAKLLEGLWYPDKKRRGWRRRGRARGAPRQRDPVPEGSFPGSLETSEGDLPTEVVALLEAGDFRLDATARGLLGPGTVTNVTWSLFRRHGARVLQLAWEGGVLLKLLCRPGVTFRAYINCYPWPKRGSIRAEILPLLSVVHLACKMAAEIQVPAASHSVQARTVAMFNNVTWGYNKKISGYHVERLDVMWQDAGYVVEKDSLWGLSVLHMWNRGFWQSMLEFPLILAFPTLSNTWELRFAPWSQGEHVAWWEGRGCRGGVYFDYVHDVIRLTVKSPNHHVFEVKNDNDYEVSELWHLL
eukprot:jgi/Botrbrau1/21888/Bobra.0249s0017.1